jgi:hypothetical protein
VDSIAVQPISTSETVKKITRVRAPRVDLRIVSQYVLVTKTTS